jgi:CHAT domain-containing protein/tetratricopeptide (TPR) repeat protein
MIIPPQAALALATVLAPTPTVRVAPGVESFPLDRMQWRRHEVTLEAGQLVQVTLRQRHLDVMLRLVGPDGRVLVDAVDASAGPTGLEPASILAGLDGVHAVEVWAPWDVDLPGRYDLEVSAPRAPGERDRRRLAVEALMLAGARINPSTATSGRRLGKGSSERTWSGIEIFGRAARSWAELGETCFRAEATMWWGAHQLWAHRLEESSETLHEAAGLWQDCGDDHKLAETVLYLGRVLVAGSRNREAAELYEHGLRTVEGRYPVMELQFVVQLARVYGQLGDTDQALAYGLRALPALRARKWEQGQGMTLLHLGRAYYRRGELERSVEALLEALPLHRASKEAVGEVETLALLGDAWDALGEPDVAIGHLEDAVAAYEKVLPLSIASVRSRLASLLHRAGRRDQALEQVNRTLSAAQGLGLVGAEVDARLQRARLRMEARDLEGARADVDAALAAGDATGDRVARAESLQLSGVLALRAGRADAARAALAESLALRRFAGDRVGEATALRDQAALAAAEGALDEARRLLADARAIVAERRGLLATPKLRATWSSTVREIDESYVDVLMALHRRHPADGWDARAFEAAEATAARSLLDELEGEASAGHGVAPDLLARERSARERLTDALDRQIRARATGGPAAELDRLATDVRELSTAHDRALRALRAAAPRGEEPARAPTLRLADLQAGALDAETTLVEFFVGRERGYAWVVGRDRLDAYDLPSRARLGAAVSAAHRALAQAPQRGTADPALASLRALAALVLPPDRIRLRGRRLVVVPDLPLHHVPFAALPDRSGDPLVARYEVVSAPSASVAEALRRRNLGRKPATRTLAVVADPVYDGGDERLPGASRTVADARLQSATRDFGFVDGRLPRLPFTRREALAISALVPAAETSLSLDFRASLDTALSPRLASYRLVHFAAHGLLNDVRPDLSGLVLSLVDEKGNPRPGLLTAPDVSGLRLSADLVVLSSCRSAAGREIRGEGLLGLTRAFLQAGAPRVVASLWPVDDVSSSDLMTRMYRRMLGPARASPSAALRDAQLATRRDPRWKAPYYWAGFQLQGDWR